MFLFNLCYVMTWFIHAFSKSPLSKSYSDCTLNHNNPQKLKIVCADASPYQVRASPSYSVVSRASLCSLCFRPNYFPTLLLAVCRDAPCVMTHDQKTWRAPILGPSYENFALQCRYLPVGVSKKWPMWQMCKSSLPSQAWWAPHWAQALCDGFHKSTVL